MFRIPSVTYQGTHKHTYIHVYANSPKQVELLKYYNFMILKILFFFQVITLTTSLRSRHFSSCDESTIHQIHTYCWQIPQRMRKYVHTYIHTYICVTCLVRRPFSHHILHCLNEALAGSQWRCTRMHT